MRLRGADLIVVNGRVWSDGALVPGADAVALAAGRILAVGSADDLASLAGSATRRLDAGGGTVTPGLTDAHIHLISWSRQRTQVDLVGVATRAEALGRVARFLADHPGEAPVVGRGWAAHGWSEEPDRAALDRVSGPRPVFLHSRDFHSLWVNSRALQRAGISRLSPDPEGGVIERDGAGEPTGILRENAVHALAPLEAEAARSAGDEDERLRAAAGALHAFGITGVHDFERGAAAVRSMRALACGASPGVRVLQSISHADLDHVLAAGIQSGTGDDRFRLGAVKLFADGTLGSRTAALLAPYEGTAETGMDVLGASDLHETVARAFRGGFSVAIHAIGDRACRHALDAIEGAGKWRARLPLPPRIEHAQLVDPADQPRFAALGVVASMQPSHCVADIELAEREWGSRIEHSYPWRGLLDLGAMLAFGSDAPVESPAVAPALRAALTRQREDGSPAVGFTPRQRIGLDQALAAFTAAPARLAGAWPRLGSLREGAAADLVVWSLDLHAAGPDALQRAVPRWTVLEGDVVHEAPACACGAAGAAPRGTIAAGVGRS